MIINKIQKFFFTHPLISLRHILYPVVYSARYPQRRKRAVSHRTEVLYVQQVVTVCPGSSDPFYIVSQLYKMGHYFLDTQYMVYTARPALFGPSEFINMYRYML